MSSTIQKLLDDATLLRDEIGRCKGVMQSCVEPRNGTTTDIIGVGLHSRARHEITLRDPESVYIIQKALKEVIAAKEHTLQSIDAKLSAIHELLSKD